jgi:hypothetical protein
MQLGGGYERFDGTTYVNGRSQKVSALFDKDFKPTKLQHPLTGEIFDVVSQQAIAAAAKKRATEGHERSPRTRGPEGRSRPRGDLQRAAAARDRGEGPKAARAGRPALGRARHVGLIDDRRSRMPSLRRVLPAPGIRRPRAKHDAHERFSKALSHDGRQSPDLACSSAARRARPGWARPGSGSERIDVLKLALKRTGVDPAKVKKAIADEAKAAAAC